MSLNVSARLPVCTHCHLCVHLPPPEYMGAWPQPPPKLGLMNRCLEHSMLRCRGPFISRKKELQILESAPLIQTLLHELGSLQIPINKKWQLAGLFNQRPCTAPSPHHLTFAVYLSIFLSLFLHFIILLLSLCTPPSSPFSLKNTFLSGTENKLRLWVVMLI